MKSNEIRIAASAAVSIFAMGFYFGRKSIEKRAQMLYESTTKFVEIANVVIKDQDWMIDRLMKQDMDPEEIAAEVRNRQAYLNIIAEF